MHPCTWPPYLAVIPLQPLLTALAAANVLLHYIGASPVMVLGLCATIA